MLEIFIERPENEKVIEDVEMAFLEIKLKGTELEKKVIESIENGKWNDDKSYIDRFGFKLYNSEMSTGCKAALVVINNPNEIISLNECGFNARDIIVSNCNNGKVYVENAEYVTFDDISYSGQIDVKIDGYAINSISRLNYYINNERPYKPNLRIGGISNV